LLTNSIIPKENPGYTGGMKAPLRLGFDGYFWYNEFSGGFVTPEKYKGTSTAYPSLLAVGMTWDSVLVYDYANSVGREFHQKGAHVMLGPNLNVQRNPYNGRNFESLSGEDPFVGQWLVP
jgi:beta-glucosidase